MKPRSRRPASDVGGRILTIGGEAVACRSDRRLHWSFIDRRLLPLARPTGRQVRFAALDCEAAEVAVETSAGDIYGLLWDLPGEPSIVLGRYRGARLRRR